MASPRALALTAGLVSLFLAALDQTIVATALPRIAAELHGARLFAWVATAYIVASTTMVPIYGKLSDLYGRRAVLLFGIVAFVATSALCGLARSMETLIAFRALQGAAGAALTSTAFALPADLFAPAERARLQGIFGAVFGVSSLVGPVLGGVLTDALGWPSIFYVNVPVGGVALALAARHVPRARRGERVIVDYAGAAALLATTVPLLIALSLEHSVHGLMSPLRGGLLVTAALSGAIFFVVERRARSPILPFDLFASPTFTLTCLGAALVGAAFFAGVLFLPLFAIDVLGISATRAGTIVLPLTLTMIVASMLSGRLAARTGSPLMVVAVGLLFAAAGFTLLANLGNAATPASVRVRVVLLGLGFGPALPLLTAAIQNAVDRSRIGVATAARQFFQQIGASIGSATFGAVLASTVTAHASFARADAYAAGIERVWRCAAALPILAAVVLVAAHRLRGAGTPKAHPGEAQRAPDDRAR